MIAGPSGASLILQGVPIALHTRCTARTADRGRNQNSLEIAGVVVVPNHDATLSPGFGHAPRQRRQ